MYSLLKHTYQLSYLNKLNSKSILFIVSNTGFIQEGLGH